MVRFIHQDHQIVQIRQLLEVGLADIFGEPLDPGLLAALCFRVDLGDVEDIDIDGFFEEGKRSPARVVVAQ